MQTDNHSLKVQSLVFFDVIKTFPTTSVAALTADCVVTKIG
ncbi:MAG: hypothetical protein ACTS41_00350 [Candidatus Hodgkinia cicadicola]